MIPLLGKNVKGRPNLHLSMRNHNLSVTDGILLKSTRAIVSTSLRPSMLNKIHHSHRGAECLLVLLETFCQTCPTFTQYGKQATSKTMLSRPTLHGLGNCCDNCPHVNLALSTRALKTPIYFGDSLPFIRKEPWLPKSKALGAIFQKVTGRSFNAQDALDDSNALQEVMLDGRMEVCLKSVLSYPVLGKVNKSLSTRGVVAILAGTGMQERARVTNNSDILSKIVFYLKKGK
ncbi:hypothetical protein OS493_007016 [Desmophyllum pertusum]|uniref:Uncharacterized protein n=1 Tax=Desmophyllum pertusum TaxID=174260 RepID=A0A9X0CYY6_9CNID|nr:hypothetical protein OS493_007016 [Desmophyllum pertusum]